MAGSLLKFNSGMGGDGSDSLANQLGQVIEFYHIPTGQTLRFKAFLTTFTDQYSSEWEESAVFGRMDAIQTFKGTTRSISLGWDVPAASFEEAKTNLEKSSLLVSMLYPTYQAGGGGATTIAASPLFKLKFMNLISDSTKFAGSSGNAKDSGLLGTIAGFTYEPDIENGFFQPTTSGAPAVVDQKAAKEGTGDGTLKLGGGKKGNKLPPGQSADDSYKLFPQTIKFQCEFKVLHQHALGWEAGTSKPRSGFNKFPYTKKQSEVDSDKGKSKPSEGKKPESTNQKPSGLQEDKLMAANQRTREAKAAKIASAVKGAL